MTTRAKEISDLGNTAYLEVDSNGNVGIGTNNPTEKFMIKGDGARMTISSNDHEVAMLGRRGSTAPNWDRGYLRLKYDSANTVVLDTDGVSYLNGGNVGIGITTPAAMLNVESSVDHASTHYLNADAQILLQNNNSASTARTVLKLEGSIGGGPSSIVYGGGTSVLTFDDRQNERMRIDSTGNVGIGTASPATTLDTGYTRVYNSGAASSPSAGKGLEVHYVTSGRTQGEGAYLISYDRDNSAYKQIAVDANNIELATSGSTKLSILSNGNVGIGTTNPGYKFQVAGIGHARGIISNPTAYGGNSGSGTKGSTTLGAGKYWDTTYATGYMHIVLPSRYNDGSSNMFFLEVKGYDFNRPGIIDLKYGGYVTPSANGGPISRAVVLDNYGGYSPGIYYSSNYGAGVCRFYWPSGVYYGSFTINTIASGNGDVIEPDELQIILNTSSTI